MEDLIRPHSPLFFSLLGLLFFARGMDFFSTWIATPNLLLEANPIARTLGWRWGLAVNVVICLTFAMWPLPAIAIATTSLLVAARNFQSAWLMHSMGEEDYRAWFTERVSASKRGLYFFCVFAQAALVAGIGGALMYAALMCGGGWRVVPFAVGIGMITYGLAVLLYTLLSTRRLRHRST